MRKFQRAAVVAAAVAGLSVLGVGVSFAGGGEDHEQPSQEYTAVANSSANAVATYGGYNTHGRGHDDPAPEGGYGAYQGQGGQ
ncbi:hypothetical protein [Streptomyces roseochromogenus]|uniref:Uncharacterized protein n=1 Tax=Streptomyces roseochromogenus subsp. oscitans DS 12.976 TaxID=1352936 RepID=V6JYV2_STRRC|nr:hypothetical protein [Streptomyces roseochromogenus]EST25057.1 hypothetical protein M878_29615 [Streptomyces roseochromogenus subsp. oscitans DS 12.976]